MKVYVYIGGGLLIVGGIVYLVNKNTNILTNAFNSLPFVDNPEKDKLENEVNKDKLDELVKTGQQPNYTDSEYKEGADKIETALKGLGNDLDKVAEVFDGVKNEVDVRKLNYHFGLRDGENMNNWLKSDLADNSYNWWVTLESGKMSTLGFVTVADMVREILRRKNIQFAI